MLSKTNDLRLRAVGADEYVRLATPWYSEPEVLELSESGADPYDPSRVRRMFESMSKKGELYVIEALEEPGWRAVGDASLLIDAIPIVIGDPAFRSRGLGTRVLELLVDRARELGWSSIRVSGVLTYNERALRMYRRAGFVPDGGRHVDSRDHELISMELRLEGTA